MRRKSNDNPAATANNLIASESLFRLGIVSDLLAPLVLTLVVLVLYRLLKPVNQSMASLMVVFLLTGVPIALLNKLNQFAALQLLSGADYLTVFTTEQLQALGEVLFILWRLIKGVNVEQWEKRAAESA